MTEHANSTQMSLIEIKDLKKSYIHEETETPALRGVTFNINKGEFVAIMGPSGSGKSTLLHILGFLDLASGGEYRFDGKTIGDYTSREMARVRNEKIGFVFQAFNLLPRVSVLENVKLPLLYANIKERLWEEKARFAIESVGLSHRAGHEAYRLSGGEKQRAAIARALVNDPQVIFADEPTGNLDSKSGETVMEILNRLNKGGHTIVLVTHENDIAAYSRRILRIRDGKLESDVRTPTSI